MSVNSLNQFAKLQNNFVPVETQKAETPAEDKKSDIIVSSKKENSSLKSSYWTLAAALAATVIGGVLYSLSGRSGKAAKNLEKGVQTGEEILNDTFSSSLMKSNFKEKALAVKSKASEILTSANRIKNEIMNEFSDFIDKNGKLDKSKIKGEVEYPLKYTSPADIARLKAQESREGINLARRIIVKNADGERHFELFGTEGKIAAITDFINDSRVKHPVRTREIIFNISTDEPSFIKLINDDKSCVEYSYPGRGKKSTVITNINSFDRKLNETVFNGDKIEYYQEGSNLHEF